MAKSVIIHGVSYPDVPYINVPLVGGGGNAKFVDTDSGDAVAGDIRAGKKAWVDGVEITGNVPAKSSTDVTVSGKKVTIPAGVYDSSVEKNVADGSVTPSTTLTGDEIGTTVSDYPVFAQPSATVSAGYVSTAGTGTQVTKYIQVEEKTATPSGSAQDILPSSGKLLKKVHVDAVNLVGTATAADVAIGKTFYGNSMTLQTGSYTGVSITQDSETKVLTIT